MEHNWIDNYAGEWIDQTGRVLRIAVSDDATAVVSLLVNGRPLKRPWCNNALSVDMPAKYCAGDGPGLEVALGRGGARSTSATNRRTSCFRTDRKL